MKLPKVDNKDSFMSYFDDFHAIVCSVDGCSKRAFKVAWPWTAYPADINGHSTSIQFPCFLCRDHFNEYFNKGE